MGYDAGELAIARVLSIDVFYRRPATDTQRCLKITVSVVQFHPWAPRFQILSSRHVLSKIPVSALCPHLSCGSSRAPPAPWNPWPLRARRGVPEISRTKKPFLSFALLSNGLSEDLGPVKLQRISSAQSAVRKPKGDANIQSVADWTEELLL